MRRAHSLQCMDRKPLSKADLAAAAALKKIWDEKKKALGLNQQDAAPLLGFNTQGAVSHYLNGRTPLNTDAVLKFAKLLHVAPTDIRPDLDDLLPNESRKLGSTELALHSDRPNYGVAREPRIVMVPVFDVAASMGLGKPMPHEDTVVGHLQLAENWLRTNVKGVSSPRNLSVISAYGDSMEPTFNDGDILLVDRGVEEIKVDTVYVLAFHDELYIKRVQRLPDGSVSIKSDNKLYDPFLVSGSDKQHLRVLGRVLWAWNGRKL